jgi:hypothetical protein
MLLDRNARYRIQRVEQMKEVRKTAPPAENSEAAQNGFSLACIGIPNQNGRQSLSVRIKLASANILYNWTVCSRIPRRRTERLSKW